MKQNIKNNKNSNRINYKHLLDIVDRNGAQYIEMNMNDMLPFIKYVNKVKYKPKLYVKIVGNKVRFSKQVLCKTKVDIKSEIEHNELINNKNERT